MLRALLLLLLGTTLVAQAQTGVATNGVRLQASQSNPFAAHSWLPPVPVVKAPPPPPPRAPALPFTYLGKLQDGANTTVFVGQGGRSHVLKSGDKLASYQVESIGTSDMVFVYLPLGEKQRLSFGLEN